jgi:ribosome maturation factor RimP
VTEALRDYLDNYSVEVSSPGFERPLRTKEHFERAVGQAVRVKTETGRASGEVVSAGEKTVQIRNGTGSKEQSPVEISYDRIVRANLIDEGTKG